MRLQKVYGDDAIDRSTVGRWAKRLSGKSGHADIHDKPRCGRPQSAHTDTVPACPEFNSGQGARDGM
jgi:hypothetical protein